MTQTTNSSPFGSALLHASIAAVALTYAWYISQTAYATTGVQFVSPLAIILLLHLGWLAAGKRLAPGFAFVVAQRAVMTAFAIAAVTLLAAVFAPMPAEASSAVEIFNVALMVLFCLLMIAVVVAVAAVVIFLPLLLIRWVYRVWKGPQGVKDTPLFDVASMAAALVFIAASSLEGVSPMLTFWSADRATSSVLVAAPADQVWRQVGQATSPAFPLPTLLHSIPRPVAIVVDEGAALGARRVVRFLGREGEGDLSLKVTARSDTEAIFQVQSDDSPIAAWVRHTDITFRVDAQGEATRLTVSLGYERLLSPAWFFRPYMHLAAALAMGVLARDTKARAEAARPAAL